MKKTYLLLSGLMLLLLWAACGERQTAAEPAKPADSSGKVCLAPSDRNPNGASPLASLMRDMEKQTETWKKEITDGKAELSPVPDIYRTLKTALPTEPQMKNEHFDAFSDDFLGYADALVKAGKNDRKPAFNSMVNGCMNCHTQMCPGPVKRIRRFFFE